MKVSFQSYKKGSPRLQIEVNSEDTVLDLKKKIEDVLGAKEFPAADQILWYWGRVLEPSSSTLRELNVSELGVVGIDLILPRKKPVWFPHAIWGYADESAGGACSSTPRRPKLRLDHSRVGLNFVARASLSMCKDPRYGVKVYTRRKNLGKNLNARPGNMNFCIK